MIWPLRLETNWEQTWNINIGCLLMFMKVRCTQIFLVLLKEHSSSAFFWNSFRLVFWSKLYLLGLAMRQNLPICQYAHYQHHSAFAATAWPSLLSMPTVSNWRLEYHHCHKPHAGWAHLVSDKRLLTLIAGQCYCSTRATCKARGWMVRISSALSHSTLARLTWREKHF